MKTKTYTSESCHDIGYGWQIIAPASLTEEDVKAFQEALCQWSDAPDNEALAAMFIDEDYCEQYELDVTKLKEFRKIKIEVRSVHRDVFTQNFMVEK